MAGRVMRVAEIATTKEKAGILPVSPATIWRWVRDGKFPKPFKIGAGVTVWHAAEVEAFVAGCAALTHLKVAE
ncbi:AlpA family phage regulatory protein [Massilia sp. DJPM01]|uniref:helix-turn-helix transcriptional regulator n=1 Tax=Massilia sp. DJPM01 TaxID=3024404 RepID=UPI00259E0557|nr:AlpA family phage regulatory protein [Massilia sp. DJPM01]MDM5181631.1 AlpA family phage regulatory protein [Massilia sp. DJPM01]